MQREDIEWVNSWREQANGNPSERWAILGDSVTRQYRSKLQNLLGQDIALDFWGTSFFLKDYAFLKELEFFFSYNEYVYDIIIINCCAHHGFTYQIAGNDDMINDYKEAYDNILKMVSNKCKRLVFLASTPHVECDNLLCWDRTVNREIETRNMVLNQLAHQYNATYIDQYQYAYKIMPIPQYTDDRHFDRKIDIWMAKQVYNAILGDKYPVIEDITDLNLLYQTSNIINTIRALKSVLASQKMVYLYGAGKVGRALRQYIECHYDCNIKFIVSDDQETAEKSLRFSQCVSSLRGSCVIVTLYDCYDVERLLNKNGIEYYILTSDLMTFFMKYSSLF